MDQGGKVLADVRSDMGILGQPWILLRCLKPGFRMAKHIPVGSKIT